MTTAIIGVGNLGSALARHLVGGDEPIVLAAKDDSHAEAVSQEIGPLARAASVEYAIVTARIPADAHYVNAFGTLSADALASAANREPRRAVLFYATDDDIAAGTVERLSRPAGFDPVKAGGVGAALRIEMPGGDLHQMGLNGELLDLDRAREYSQRRR